jgi:hypothetical protein
MLTGHKNLTPTEDNSMKMTPSEAFVETMVANNVTDMFGIMGLHPPVSV